MNESVFAIIQDKPQMVDSGLGICTGEDWSLLHLNDHLANFLQQPAQDLAGKSFIRCLQQMGAVSMSTIIASSAPNLSLPCTARNRHYSFSWSPLDINNAKIPLAISSPGQIKIFILREIQFPQNTAHRAYLNNYLKTLMNSVHDGIWIIDPQGTTLYVNRAMRRIAGIKAEDVVGQHVSTPMKRGVFTSCVTLEALEKKEVITRFDDYSTGKRCLNTSTPLFDENGNIQCVVACIRDMSELESLQAKLAEAEQMARRYKEQLDCQKNQFTSPMIAQSPAMHSYLHLLERAATVSSSVLILGETGTGKTLAARYIHNKSPRAKGPFVTVNCAAIAPTLIESELFGYEKGAFTGANAEGKKGFFQMADGGTLFLDEIGELPISMQAKLLHVLDNLTFHRVGGTRQITVDVRIVAATNRPLEKLVEEGSFREDLYYRLRVLSATTPPLRERTGDISAIAYYFLKEACARYGIIKYFEPKIVDYLIKYPWPGNVRELQATVEFLAVMAEGNIIKAKDLPPQIKAYVSTGDEELRDLKTAVQELEYVMIKNALLKTGSTYKAAKILGISQSTVVRKAQQLNIKTT